MGMVEFTHYRTCCVPLEVLTESEERFLACREILPGPDRSGNLFFWNLKVLDFPGIFYSNRNVSFHDMSVPLYAPVLLNAPYQVSTWERYEQRKKEMLAMEQFMSDLNDFPVQPFYERLLRLRGIGIEQDCSLKDVGGAVARPGKVVFDGSLESHLVDFMWFAHATLHEMYHLVEFEMGGEAERYFNGRSMWKLKRKCLFYDEAKTLSYGGGHNPEQFIFPHTYLCGVRARKSCNMVNAADVMQRRLFTELSFYDLSWRGDGNEHRPSHELAEWLTALTLVRHSRILFEIYPYYAAVCERFSPQLSLFSAKPERIWGI